MPFLFWMPMIMLSGLWNIAQENAQEMQENVQEMMQTGPQPE
jgi:hypothetical protein